MTIDIDRLSARDLDTLISKAKKRKTTLGTRKPVATVRRKVAALGVMNILVALVAGLLFGNLLLPTRRNL